MIICQICNKTYKNIQSLSRHLKINHNIDNKQNYYDLYLKKPNEGICKLCGKPTHFYGMDRGYNKYCSRSCQVKDQGNGAKINHIEMWKIKHNKIKQYEKDNNCINLKNAVDKYGNLLYIAIDKLHIPIIKESKMYQYIDNSYLLIIENFINEYNLNKSNKSNIIINTYQKQKDTIRIKNEQFEQDNNCTQIGKLISKYGQGWKSLKLPVIERNHNAHFISNEYIPVIEEYSSSYYASNKEKYIYNKIKSIYNSKIIHNTKRIIPHQELDIYIPALNIAIEFNGLYWHSLEHGTNKDYHLNKSIACREKEIRLIHIYEFEDLDNQIQLLCDLILGIDNYPKNDFNKNNLIDTIPNYELIYKGTKEYPYHIYGAGKLY